MNVKVIDISSWQTNVDFKQVKKSGIKAVMIRTGYWTTTDAQFKNHMAGAISAGLDIGVYTYLKATTVEEAKQEAEYALKVIEPYKQFINYPVWADMEDEQYLDTTKFTTKDRTDILLTYLDTVSKAGYYVGIYTNPSWLYYYLDTRKFDKYDRWLAAWTYNPNKVSTFVNDQTTMWQWGSTYSLNGIVGEVDMDICFVDYPSRINNTIPGFTSVKWVGRSEGKAAKRKEPNKNSDIVSRCEKGKYYPFIKYGKVDGKTWLMHEDGTYSMYKDLGTLFTLYQYSEYKVTANLLNVRNRPNGDIVGQVKNGTILIGMSEQEDWLKIEYDNSIAYVSLAYVQKLD